MTHNEPPSQALRIFGRQSRFLREQLGLTRGELARQIPYSESFIAMVERGERPPKPEYIEAVDAALGAEGYLRNLAPEVAERDHPTWAQEYVDLQAKALALHGYSTHNLHGLLQTERYARAVFRCLRPSLDDQAIDRNTQARLATQRLLTREPACRLTFVLEEVILRRMIGGPEVREEQLRHLLKVGQLHNVQLQVMPDSVDEHAGLDGPMSLLETPEYRTVGYVEGQRGSYFLTQPDDISTMSHRYGAIRAQALGPKASLSYIHHALSGES